MKVHFSLWDIPWTLKCSFFFCILLNVCEKLRGEGTWENFLKSQWYQWCPHVSKGCAKSVHKLFFLEEGKTELCPWCSHFFSARLSCPGDEKKNKKNRNFKNWTKKRKFNELIFRRCQCWKNVNFSFQERYWHFLSVAWLGNTIWIPHTRKEASHTVFSLSNGLRCQSSTCHVGRTKRTFENFKKFFQK